MLNNNFWKRKKVLITGHTGFKGSWLSTILSQLGSDLYGYSLKPKSKKQLYVTNRVEKYFKKIKYDNINNFQSLKNFVHFCKPSVVFHLAAQPIVLESYAKPLETFSTNIIGSANLLESLRSLKSLKTLIIVTSDKCYLNEDKKLKLFRETDPLGGYDPYSASKAGTEIITLSYYKSFFEKKKVSVSTVRAGNVIGGGDVAKNRIFSDISKSLISNKKLILRNPNAIRPWQHVLEPLIGYIILAEKMYKSRVDFSTSWNFGPKSNSNKRVIDVIRLVNKFKKIRYTYNQNKKQNYESKNLGLNIDKVNNKLKWKPKLSLKETIRWTVDWYLSKNKKAVTLKQIKEYIEM